MGNKNINDVDIVRNNGFSDETAPELKFASSLNPRKTSHKMIAFIMLIAMAAFELSSIVQFF